MGGNRIKWLKKFNLLFKKIVNKIIKRYVGK